MTGCAAPAPKDGGPAPRGATTLTVDNDSYSFDDSNYTNGVLLSWSSPELDAYPAGHGLRRAANTLSPLLPRRPGSARHVAISAGQLIFTPERLLNDNPAPDDRPYAGILFVDTTAMERGPDSLATATLRLGLVGEASMAEEVQKELHEWFGADRPRGWSHQLEYEPIFNLGLERHRRFGAGTLLGFDHDFTHSVGAALGTYFTGLAVGLEWRFGGTSLGDMGSRTMTSGFQTTPLVARPDSARARTYGFLRGDAWGVARFLPLDGTFFRDGGRSTDREDFVGAVTLGVTMAQGPVSMTFSYRFLSDTYETQNKTGQYGTLSLTWFPGRR